MMKKILSSAFFLASFCALFSVIVPHANAISTDEAVSSFDQTHCYRVPSSQEEGEFVSYDVGTGEVTYFNVESIENSTSPAYEKTSPGYIPPNMVVDNISLISPQGVIGSDDRVRVNPTTVYPNSAVAYIEATFPDGKTGRGTAFMVSKNVAVTCGHCVYNSDHGGWATSAKVIPGKNGYGIANNPYGSSGVKNFQSNSNWVNNANQNYDYAIVEMISNLGEKSGWFSLTYTSNDLTGLSVITYGYPSLSASFYQYKATGIITKVLSSVNLHTNVDATNGQSGSPLCNNNTRSVVGIVKSESPDTNENIALRITKNMYDMISTYIS